MTTMDKYREQEGAYALSVPKEKIIPFRSAVPKHESTMLINNPNTFRQIRTPKLVSISKMYAFFEADSMVNVEAAMREIQERESRALAKLSDLRETANTNTAVDPHLLAKSIAHVAKVRTAAILKQTASIASLIGTTTQSVGAQAQAKLRVNQERERLLEQERQQRQEEEEKKKRQEEREQPQTDPQQEEPGPSNPSENTNNAVPVDTPATHLRPLTPVAPTSSGTESTANQEDSDTASSVTNQEQTMDDPPSSTAGDNDQGPEEEVIEQDPEDQEEEHPQDHDPITTFVSVFGKLPEVVAFQDTFTPKSAVSKVWHGLQNLAFQHAQDSNGLIQKVQFFFDAVPFFPSTLQKNSSTEEITTAVRTYIELGGDNVNYFDQRYARLEPYIPQSLKNIGINFYAISKGSQFWTFRIFVKSHSRVVVRGGGQTLLNNMGFPFERKPGESLILTNDVPGAPEWKIYETKVNTAKLLLNTPFHIQGILEPRNVYGVAPMTLTIAKLRELKSSYPDFVSFVNTNAFQTINQQTGFHFGIDPEQKRPYYYHFGQDPGEVSVIEDSTHLGNRSVFPTEYAFYPSTLGEALVTDASLWLATDPNLKALSDLYDQHHDLPELQTAMSRMIYDKTESPSIVNATPDTLTSDPPPSLKRRKRSLVTSGAHGARARPHRHKRQTGPSPRVPLPSNLFQTAHYQLADMVRRLGPLFLSVAETMAPSSVLGDTFIILYPRPDGSWAQDEGKPVLVPKQCLSEDMWTINVCVQTSYIAGENRADYSALCLPMKLCFSGILSCQMQQDLAI